jgi:Tfp pilus assembly protein PilZ
MAAKGHFRSSPRPQASHPVTLHLNNGMEIAAFTRDVSKGGLFVVTDRQFAMGEALDVSLSSPSTWEPLRLHAEVCRVVTDEAEPGVGLRFVRMTDRQLVALIDLTVSHDFES